MSDLHVLVANCLLAGDQVTHRGDSWIRNVVEFNCSGRAVVFTQSDAIAAGNVRPVVGQFCETSDVLVKNVAPTALPRVLRLMDRLCWLLSFAAMSRVVWYGYDYPAGSPNRYRRSVQGTVSDFRPVLDVRDVTAIQSYVKQVFPAYERLERGRKLNAVIDYLVRADSPGQATEIRLLLAFVTLENLKDTYARSKAFPYTRGAYRKGSASNAQKYTFEELLRLMLEEVGMKRGLKTIVRLRNEIVHSGLSRLPHKSQWSIYERVQDIAREYVLRLLGYRGTYFTHSSGGNAPRAV